MREGWQGQWLFGYAYCTEREREKGDEREDLEFKKTKKYLCF